MNWQVVKDLVAYGREQEKLHDKKFRFTLTTNGILLNDEVQEFVNKEMSNVVLSIDGRKEVNDRMRPFRNGHGSYDIIVPKFRKLADSRNQTNYYVRGTFTRNNLDFCEDVLHMADLGFKQVSVEPVVAAPEEDYAIREEDIPFICEQYDKLAAEMVKRHGRENDFNFFHFMIDLTGGPCVYKRLSGCGSGTEYLAVTPWGDLYPCHQFVGEEAYKLGDIWNGVTNTALREEFRSCNAYARPECNDCWARFYCSGGCAANAYHATGSITGVYEYGCELFKKRIECAIMIKVAENQELAAQTAKPANKRLWTLPSLILSAATPSSAPPGCICRATRAAARWAVRRWTSPKLRARTSCTRPKASSPGARPTPRSSSAPPAPITAPRAAASASGPCSTLRSRCSLRGHPAPSCWRRGTPTRPYSTQPPYWTSTSGGSGPRRTPPGRSAPALWSRRPSPAHWTG